MEFTGTVSASFSASHVVKDHPRCGRLHGHRWIVSVTIKAGQDPATGELLGMPELAQVVESIARENDREHINDMVPGTHPTPAGLCLAVRERLALNFPSIDSVSVWMDEEGATLRD